MENMNITAIAITLLVAIALIFFVIIRNRKDKKNMNPSAPDAVEENKGDDIINNRREL